VGKFQSEILRKFQPLLTILLVGFGHMSRHRGVAAFEVGAPMTGDAFALE
jgi:hypothetical protein